MAGFPERNATLRDGTPVLLREARPEDAPLVQMGFAQLSDRSRQFRFLRATPRLSDDDLSFLVGADSNEVIGALDVSGEVAEPVGLARYVRMPTQPETAEVAVTVVDSHQGRGLGTLLFGCLAWQAERTGIRRFVALVHQGNAPMRGLLEELGASVEEDHGGELQYVLPLHSDQRAYPATPAGDAFRTAAALAEGRLTVHSAGSNAPQA
jgi:RimJ/RimL family protein N-acetyltransferase